jgi:murein DD-endopeptidase MepM/ murein hydrolase activator NlpD
VRRRWLLPTAAAWAIAAAGACRDAAGPGETCAGYTDWQASPYVLPYPVGRTYRVLQGNCSGFGHSGVYRYSIDFDMPLGSVVTAARAGTVVEVRTGHVDGDTVSGHENFVKILHDDGVISAYSHLGTSGVLVAVGTPVAAGDTIGLSGNTGATGGVRHLHFHLTPCSEPVDCGTLPVTFRNTTANPTSLLVGHAYTALPY